MSWVTLPVKAVGDIVFAADINAITSDLKFLGYPPLASYYATSNAMSTTSGAGYVPKMTAQLIDQDPTTTPIYNTSTGVFTIQTAGVYQPDGQLTFLAVNAVGYRQASWNVSKGGAGASQYCQSLKPGNATAKVSIPLACPKIRFAVGDTLYPVALQTSGAAILLDNQTQGTYAEVRLVSL